MSLATGATRARLPALDGLRGLAVIGILLMNVQAFALPFNAYANPAALGPPPPADRWLWATEFVLVDGKLRAIFSALFGAGLLLVADGAAARGASPLRANLARLLTLGLIGAGHAALLWSGDILRLYALAGLCALPLRRLGSDRLLVLAGMLLGLQLAILLLHYQALAALAAAAHAGVPAAASAWGEVLDAIGSPRPAALAADLHLHLGSWRALARTRLLAQPGELWAELLFAGPETLGLMLLGMVGLRGGALAGDWPAARVRRWAATCYLLGLPPLLAVAMLLWRWHWPPLATAAATDLVLPARWLVASGHALLLARWLAHARGRLALRLRAVGRCAFSNYLLSSLVMAALFDGWGLGWYGRASRTALLAPVVLAAGLMLAWSQPWLRHVGQGPLEWAWRRLARPLAGPRAAMPPP